MYLLFYGTEKSVRHIYIMGGELQMTPPEIIHGPNRPNAKDIPEIIDRVKTNIRLCSREYKLLLFYASCGDGFHPAKKKIQQDTGIDESDIKEVRNSLRRMSLIDYDCNQYYHFVFVNWSAILGYALLDKPLKVGGRGRKYFTPCDFRDCAGHPYHNIWEDYLKLLGKLTDFEVWGLFNEFPEDAFRHVAQIERNWDYRGARKD